MKKIKTLVLVLLGLTPMLLAQETDGRIATGEYALEHGAGMMTIYASETAQSLFLACSAPTEGWVSLGVGSMRMDGASIYIGFVSRGEARFRADLGRGHTHAEQRNAGVVAWAVGEESGRTVLELELTKSGIPFSNPLKLLVGFGSKDNFRAYHSFRDAIELEL